MNNHEEEQEILRPQGVFNAGEAVALTLNTIAERKAAFEEGRALTNMFGIPDVDNYILPFFPGDYIFVQGLPSNGKSFTTRMMGLRTVNLLKDLRDPQNVVVSATTEESVEKITTSWISAISGVNSTDMLRGKLANVHQVAIQTAVAEVASWPLWLIGHTLGSSANVTGIDVKHTSARLSMSQFEAAFDFIISQGKKIACIYFDYMHRVSREVDDTSNREQHMRHIVDWGRDMANKYSCPFVMVAQTKQEVSKWDIKLGSLESIEWTASAGQSADVVISVWMPKTNPGVGSMIDINIARMQTDENGAPIIEEGKILFKSRPEEIIVAKDMMFLRVAKQKDGDAQDTFLLRTLPHLMKWSLYPELQQVNLNPHKTDKDSEPSREYINTWSHQSSIPFDD